MALWLGTPHALVSLLAFHMFWRLHPWLVVAYALHALPYTFCDLASIFFTLASDLSSPSPESVRAVPWRLLASAEVFVRQRLPSLAGRELNALLTSTGTHYAFFYFCPRAFLATGLYATVFVLPFCAVLQFAFMAAAAFVASAPARRAAAAAALRRCLEAQGDAGMEFLCAVVLSARFATSGDIPGSFSLFASITKKTGDEESIATQILGRTHRPLAEIVADLSLHFLLGEFSQASSGFAALSLEMVTICQIIFDARKTATVSAAPAPPAWLGAAIQVPAGVNERDDIPEDFLCPITKDLMTLPVNTLTGVVCDFSGIAIWIKARDLLSRSHRTDPATHAVAPPHS